MIENKNEPTVQIFRPLWYHGACLAPMFSIGAGNWVWTRNLRVRHKADSLPERVDQFLEVFISRKDKRTAENT